MKSKGILGNVCQYCVTVVGTAIAFLSGNNDLLLAQLLPNIPNSSPPDALPSPSLENVSLSLLLLHRIEGYNTLVESLGFSADGNTLVSGGGTNEPLLKFWSVTDGKELSSFRAQSSGILALTVTPNGETLVTSGEDTDVHFWRWEERTSRAIFFNHYSNVLSLVSTPDSQIVVSGGIDGIRVWTTQPTHFLYQLTDFGDPAYALALHPDGYILASGNDKGRVRFWDLRKGTSISEFFPHEQAITDLAISRDGTTLITASTDRTIKVWQIQTGQLLHTLTGHTAPIREIALSPNGRFLASASNDGVRFWDIQRGRLLRILQQHTDWATAVAFSPDGRYLASADFDGVIYVWRVQTPVIDPVPSLSVSSPEP